MTYKTTFTQSILNRIINWYAKRMTARIFGINSPEAINSARPESVMFHTLMKYPFRALVQNMPDVPQSWLDGLTGTPKIIYNVIMEEWYANDKRKWRRDQFFKPALYFLCLWQYDMNAGEVLDYIWWKLQNQNGYAYHHAHLNPSRWYSDEQVPVTEGGTTRYRRMGQWHFTPAIIDATDEWIEFATTPHNGFCTIENDAIPSYNHLKRIVIFDPASGEKTEHGYRYQIIKTTDTLKEAFGL